MAPNKLFNSKSELHVNTVNNNSEKSDCLPGKVTHDLLYEIPMKGMKEVK